MSAFGTRRTSRYKLAYVRFWGEADMRCRLALMACKLLTHSGHRADRNPAMHARHSLCHWSRFCAQFGANSEVDDHCSILSRSQAAMPAICWPIRQACPVQEYHPVHQRFFLGLRACQPATSLLRARGTSTPEKLQRSFVGFVRYLESHVPDLPSR
jgi:hypothetical protein